MEAMAEAEQNHTPPRYYNKEARVELKQHLERVFARRGTDCKIDWEELWDNLETTARSYVRSVRLSTVLSTIEPSYRPGDVLAWFDEICKLINTLEQKLKTAPDWRFVSPSGILFRSESYAIRELIALRGKLTTDADELREFLADQKVHTHNTHDSLAELKVIMLKIGQNLLGLQTSGRSGEPLIKFAHLALLPVLGDATPDVDVLRVFAHRHL
jgi:hypothetical protein